ncbi:MAG: hypothetical protein AAF587_32955 [Bacteroidota bacterium]
MNVKTILSTLAIVGLLAGTSCTPDPDQEAQADQDQAMGVATTEAAQTQTISPPLEKVQLAFHDFEVNASEESTLTLENGTQITVPQGALVDANQQAVSGKVDIRYREFHDVVDVLLSGIPMGYDSAGESHILQTAGMMEIRASQNGSPVFIAEGKEIQVDMTSFKDDEGYNVYQFDEGENNWSFMRTSQAQQVPSSTEGFGPNADVALDKALEEDRKLAEQALPAEPFEPKRLAPDAIPFDFDVDYSRFPALAPYKELTWQYANMEEKDCINPETSEWVFGEVWSSATVQEHPRKKGIFYFTLRNTDKEAKILVTPVVEDENYEATMAVFEKIKQQQQARRQRILEARKRIQRQMAAAERHARISRAFFINSFGIYNIDRIWNQSQVMVKADFGFDQFSLPISSNDIEQVYLLMPEANSVIPISRTKWKQFRYDPRTANMVLAFLPGNEVALFSNEDFIEQKPSGEFVFQMRETQQTIDSPADLRNLLAGV